MDFLGRSWRAWGIDAIVTGTEPVSQGPFRELSVSRTRPERQSALMKVPFVASESGSHLIASICPPSIARNVLNGRLHSDV